jgi:mRNA-degrading endonuclease RelE of RelBE toxin-antitoxin system
MEYEIRYKPGAQRDLNSLSPPVRLRILKKPDALRHDLAGDVKRLVSYNQRGDCVWAIGVCCSM